MDKKKKRARAHAAKHGMSYQAAYQQLYGNPNGNPNGLANKPMEFWAWCDHLATTDACLTLGQVRAMKDGQEVPVLSVHRNLCDEVYPSGGAVPRPPQPAATFFADKRSLYIHAGGFMAGIQLPWDTEAKHTKPVPIELEFKPGFWHPLTEDGFIPGKAETGRRWKQLPDERRHWSDFPDETLVGWRGPMVHWERLGSLPPIFTRVTLDALAEHSIWTKLASALGIDSERISVRRKLDHWLLIVTDLSQDELDLAMSMLEGSSSPRRPVSVEVVDRDAWQASRMYPVPSAPSPSVLDKSQRARSAKSIRDFADELASGKTVRAHNVATECASEGVPPADLEGALRRLATHVESTGEIHESVLEDFECLRFLMPEDAAETRGVSPLSIDFQSFGPGETPEIRVSRARSTDDEGFVIFQPKMTLLVDVPSDQEPGYIHKAGSTGIVVEVLESLTEDPNPPVWLAEIRVPDDSLEGGAWYETVELRPEECVIDTKFPYPEESVPVDSRSTQLAATGEPDDG